VSWIQVCDAEDIGKEDVFRFDHAGRTFAIYRSPDDRYFATDGLCTHEKIHLADGLVLDDTIECPKHNGLFNYMTGEAMGAPVCINLKTYPIKIEDGKVLLSLE
jgi:3-phenylpropionate/trans-cinnamate dioxygenase ferredoxin subunit